MLELRVKIQLLQTDNDFLNKLRDDLMKELETLQVQQLQQVTKRFFRNYGLFLLF
jgi:hypothetical protein